MSAMEELIERLEKATGQDRELDGRIWAEMDGRDVRIAWLEHWGKDGLLAKSRRPSHDECVVGVFMDEKLYTVGQSNPPPEFTKSIDAALTLLPEGSMWSACDMEDGPFAQVLRPMPCGGYVNGLTAAKAATVPTALCIAALRARATPHV